MWNPFVSVYDKPNNFSIDSSHPFFLFSIFSTFNLTLLIHSNKKSAQNCRRDRFTAFPPVINTSFSLTRSPNSAIRNFPRPTPFSSSFLRHHSSQNEIFILSLPVLPSVTCWINLLQKLPKTIFDFKSLNNKSGSSWETVIYVDVVWASVVTGTTSTLLQIEWSTCPLRACSLYYHCSLSPSPFWILANTKNVIHSVHFCMDVVRGATVLICHVSIFREDVCRISNESTNFSVRVHVSCLPTSSILSLFLL